MEHIMDEHKLLQNEVCFNFGHNKPQEDLSAGKAFAALMMGAVDLWAVSGAARVVADYLILPYFYGIGPR